MHPYNKSRLCSSSLGLNIAEIYVRTSFAGEAGLAGHAMCPGLGCHMGLSVLSFPTAGTSYVYMYIYTHR